MDDKILDIIVACIPVIGMVLTYFVVPFIKEKIGTEKLNQWKKWADTAVNAAEIMFNGSSRGDEKKAFVVDALDKVINGKKQNITEEQLNMLIEASVNALKNIK